MENTLYYGDNLEILRKYIKDESVDLIYLDPPFNSNTTYNVLFKDEKGQSRSQIKAFTDFWHWDEESAKTYNYLINDDKVPAKVKELIFALHQFLGENQMNAYLVMMSVRLIELHRVLKDDGSLYLHCDPTASHYIKLVLDSIFGQKNFRNEIIWAYSTSGRPKDRFPWKHDTIFCYGKTNKTFFNVKEVKVPYSEEYINTHFPYKDKTGRVYRKRFDAGKWRIYYADEGMIPNDVWEIPYVNSMSPERLGYPTQKPLILLERIIKASSRDDGIILDPFCGCGTTIDAVEKINKETNSNRKWIGIDITHLAINLIKRRIADKYGKLPNIDFKVVGEPQDLASARQLALEDRYQFQWWAISLVDGIPKDKKKGADRGIDGLAYYALPDKTIKIAIQVKSGHVKRNDISTFATDIDSEGAEFGIFITLETPTNKMIKEAVDKGFIKDKIRQEQIPRIEIITIEELLNGKIPKVQAMYGKTNSSYKKADRYNNKIENGYYKKL